ncbi:hypothetical protein GWI33_003509 [Rhynchophorus ferrugineus]|uniref:Uncharacterized protein n=1 Tax=Rhynchophorus ferrugineus TaxID=354439 RepID=A0A834LX24_RHYFE|nr:hypothetical protein GWI33_003511 [Rhynchophorus ferrugineus]KAF7263201.1 hypothetical protein GWI33_003509 [Rhynchophorus ferrugineus]
MSVQPLLSEFDPSSPEEANYKLNYFRSSFLERRAPLLITDGGGGGSGGGGRGGGGGGLRAPSDLWAALRPDRCSLTIMADNGTGVFLSGREPPRLVRADGSGDTPLARGNCHGKMTAVERHAGGGCARSPSLARVLILARMETVGLYEFLLVNEKIIVSIN